MGTELTVWEAEIGRYHNEATRLCGEAIKIMGDALKNGRNCGGAITDWQENNKGKTLSALRDIVPYGQARKYIALFKMERDGGAQPTDAQAMRLLPLFGREVEDRPAPEPSQQRPEDKIVRAASKLVAILADMTSADPISRWSRAKREAMLALINAVYDSINKYREELMKQ